MMKYLKYFITPVLSLAVMIGILLGGHWMWFGLASRRYAIAEFCMGIRKRNTGFSWHRAIVSGPVFI